MMKQIFKYVFMLMVFAMSVMTIFSCGGNDEPDSPSPPPSPSYSLIGTWTYNFSSGYVEMTFNTDGTGTFFEFDKGKIENREKFTYQYNNGIVSIYYEDGEKVESTITWQNDNSFTASLGFDGNETWVKKSSSTNTDVSELTDDQIKNMLINKIWMLETNEYYVYIKYYNAETYTEDYPYKHLNDSKYYTIVQEGFDRYKSEIYGSDSSTPTKWQYHLEKGWLQHSVGSYYIVSITNDELVLAMYSPSNPERIVYKAVSSIPPVGAYYNKPIGGNTDKSGSLNGHQYVDLGLPSGTLWATCNVGATKPEEYGDYFAWGETKGYNSGKRSFDSSAYKWCNGSDNGMTKYCTSTKYGIVDNKTTLDLTDDVAHVNWGGSWRMPTIADFTELYYDCIWTWTTLGGINGYKVTSKTNGNYIFLPAAGYRGISSFGEVGSNGNYWSSSLDETVPNKSKALYFGSSNINIFDYSYRRSGRSIRAVCK